MMALDLSKEFPRSGRDKVREYVWLGRMNDKARAAAAGTVDEYIFP